MAVNQFNQAWISYANRKRCRHADVIRNLGFISLRMRRALFAIGDIVYLFMSDERCIRFKVIVTEEYQERQDKEYWVKIVPNDKTYKLELLEGYNCSQLLETTLLQHGFKGRGKLRNSQL